MATKEDYLLLGKRISDLKEQRAVLLAIEEEKRKERAKLEAELKAAGIDPTKIREESTRLEKEIQEEYDQAKARVDQFEQELNAVVNGETEPTTPTKAPAVLPAPKELKERQPARPNPTESQKAPVKEPVPTPQPAIEEHSDLLDDLEIG